MQRRPITATLLVLGTIIACTGTKGSTSQDVEALFKSIVDLHASPQDVANGLDDGGKRVREYLESNPGSEWYWEAHAVLGQLPSRANEEFLMAQLNRAPFKSRSAAALALWQHQKAALAASNLNSATRIVTHAQDLTSKGEWVGDARSYTLYANLLLILAEDDSDASASAVRELWSKPNLPKRLLPEIYAALHDMNSDAAKELKAEIIMGLRSQADALDSP